jgi:hypothetical protein
MCTINILNMRFSTIAIFVTDITLLLIMLLGLFRLGFHKHGVFDLGHLMWRQVGLSALLLSRGVPQKFIILHFHKGLIWLSLAIIAYIPPVVGRFPVSIPAAHCDLTAAGVRQFELQR